MFEKEAISKAVSEQLATVPKDHKIAVVTVADSNGVKVVTAVRKGDWEVQGYATYKLEDHKVGYGASLVWSK